MLSLVALIYIYSSLIVPDKYATIQEAVGKASPGDVIVVSEGSYKENVLITKPLSIKARNGRDNTTVMAADPAKPVFKVSNTDKVEISGFTATGSSLSGIYLDSANNVTISNNRTVKNGTGITLHASSNNILANNLADSNDKYGIYLESSHRNTLNENRVNTNADKGVFLSSSNNNDLTDNSVNLNVWNGVLLWDSNNNTLRDNRVWRNRFGIVISEGGNNTLINNSAWSNIYVIMPLVLAYLGIISYLIQKRVLQSRFRV